MTDALKDVLQACGEWTSSSGGSHSDPNFYTNPQFLLDLSGATAAEVSVKLQGPDHLSMNCLLVRGSQRISKSVLFPA